MTRPTDALRLVPVRATPQMIAAMDKNIFGQKMDLGSDFLHGVWASALAAAPASPLPEGGGWQDVSTFTESGQGSPVIVAVPTKEGGWIVGEAWKSVMEPDDPYRGNDGWWWAGTSPGDAYNDPIRFMNHGDAEWWMPLPAAPTCEA